MTKSICESLGNPSWSKTTEKLDLSSSLKWCFHSLFSCIWTLSRSEAHLLSRLLVVTIIQRQNSLKFLSWVTICLASHTDTWRWVNVEKKTNHLNNFKASNASFYNLESFQCGFFFFSCVNRIDTYLGVKCACYIKILTSSLIELLHSCAKGILDALVVIRVLNLALRTWVIWTCTDGCYLDSVLRASSPSANLGTGKSDTTSAVSFASHVSLCRLTE